MRSHGKFRYWARTVSYTHLDVYKRQVYLDGADLLGMKGTERARRMAVMFTEKVHAEWMTCRDVVAAGRYPYTGRFGVLSEEDWKAVDEAMEAVQVLSLIHI